MKFIFTLISSCLLMILLLSSCAITKTRANNSNASFSSFDMPSPWPQENPQNQAEYQIAHQAVH